RAPNSELVPYTTLFRSLLEGRRRGDLDGRYEHRLGARVARHHDSAHPSATKHSDHGQDARHRLDLAAKRELPDEGPAIRRPNLRSEEHTSELQSRGHLV